MQETMHQPSEALVAKLYERQLAAGKNERQFAALLGVSQATWNQTRGGKKPGLKFIAGVLRRYPDLRKDVVRFLEEEPGLMESWSQTIPA